MKVASLWTMKASAVILAATAAVTEAVDPSGAYNDPKTVAQKAPEDRTLYLDPNEGDPVDKITFDECIGQTLEACRGLVETAITENPGVFTFDVSDLNFYGVPIRQETDEGYNKVFIRMDKHLGILSEGVLGDGMIFYPFTWHALAGDMEIGPWDCAPSGTPHYYPVCCNLVKAAVPADINGNELECVPEYPMGHSMNPTYDNRVIAHINEAGVVVRGPRLE